jgi:hypothetical protein
MRITNQNQTPVPSNGNNAEPTPAPRNDASSPVSSSSHSPSSPVGMEPSFEFLSLTAALNQIPLVRQDVISDTIDRLEAGQLQTPSALEQTARAMLGL